MAELTENGKKALDELKNDSDELGTVLNKLKETDPDLARAAYEYSVGGHPSSMDGYYGVDSGRYAAETAASVSGSGDKIKTFTDAEAEAIHTPFDNFFAKIAGTSTNDDAEGEEQSKSEKTEKEEKDKSEKESKTESNALDGRKAAEKEAQDRARYTALAEYDSDETRSFSGKLGLLGLDVEAIITKCDNLCNALQGDLNPETLAKIGDLKALFSTFRDSIQKTVAQVDSLKADISKLIEGNEEADFNPENLPDVENLPEDTDSDPEGTPYSGSPKGTSHSGSDDDGDSADYVFPTSLFDSGEKISEIQSVENAGLIAASIGSLVFSSAINLYESIGGTAIQSNSNTQYGLLGVEKVNDIFYYKLIDKTTGKIYYAASGDVSLTVEILHTKEESMLLNSTDIGADDNFEKLSDVDKYFVVTEKQDVNGVEFATILDSTDGKTYYVPYSSSTEYEVINEVLDSVEGGN